MDRQGNQSGFVNRDIAVALRSTCLVVSFIYGFALMLMSFAAAGVGHGTYVLMGISAAPVSLSQDILWSLLAIPVWWLTVSLVAAFSRLWICRILFVVLMASHYASLFWVLEKPSVFADFGYIRRVEGFFWFSIVCYFVGQLVLWAIFFMGIAGHQVRISKTDQEAAP